MRPSDPHRPLRRRSASARRPGAAVLRGLVDRAGIDPATQDVILGCASQAGEDKRDVARMALLRPTSVEAAG